MYFPIHVYVSPVPHIAPITVVRFLALRRLSSTLASPILSLASRLWAMDLSMM